MKPFSNPIDAELYDWVLQYTARDSLFYGCFGSETMTYFRRKTQRSISHNWKDLSFMAHHRATLVSAYNRFRELEAACKTFDSAVAAAHTLKSDYSWPPAKTQPTFYMRLVLPTKSMRCLLSTQMVAFQIKPHAKSDLKMGCKFGACMLRAHSIFIL